MIKLVYTLMVWLYFMVVFDYLCPLGCFTNMFKILFKELTGLEEKLKLYVLYSCNALIF